MTNTIEQLGNGNWQYEANANQRTAVLAKLV